jgi:hypothetical protein
MDNKGQVSTVSHVLLWVVVAVIGVWLVWSATHSNNEKNNYQPGSSSSDNHSNRWPLTFDFNFSCVPQRILQEQGDKGGNHGVITNGQISH